MVICCNALKKMGSMARDRIELPSENSVLLPHRASPAIFFVDYRQGILVNRVCTILLSAQRKGNHGNEIVSRSHWKQPVAAYNFFWNGVVERH
jgi:hypothetical protein